MKEPAPSHLHWPAPVPEENPVTVLRESLAEESQIRLQDYWRILRKRWRLIAIFFLGVVSVTIAGLLLMAPVYTARTTLLIERRNPQVLDIKEVFSESLLGPDEYDYYRTQYEILKSRNLAAQIIQEQGLESALSEQSFLASLTNAWVQQIKAWLRRWLPFLPEPPVVHFSGVDPRLVDAYLDDMLEVSPVARTRLVQVGISSHDAELSARVVNAHAQAYIRQGLGIRNRATEEAQEFLREHLVELKNRVEKAEAALNRYRRNSKIISLDDKENIVVDRLADLNKRLTEAEAERITLEPQVRLIAEGKYDSLPLVLSNPIIHKLKEQLARLEANYANLSEKFTDDYPAVAQVKAQVEETTRRLRREIQILVVGAESAYAAAREKEKDLRSKMEEQRALALSLKDASVEYGILAREADSNLQLYNTVLQRMKEMEVAAELPSSNVVVVDEAYPPLAPSKPQKLFSLFLGSLLGLVGGVGAACFVEYLDNTLETPQEVERYLHLPQLGLVPDFTKLNQRTYTSYALPLPSTSQPKPPGKGKDLVLSHHPLSVVTESYRALRTAILLSRAEEPPKTILFTSSIQGEGKTTTALNTAIIFAKMGVRVLVIDADLRRSRCHTVLAVGDSSGLTEVLTGQKELDEVIKNPLEVPNLFFLGSGAPSPNPTELVGSRKMKETLRSLQERYDYILLDGPPATRVSDAILLSTMVDGVVMVIDAQKTPKQAAREARARLGYARANMLGTVLNRVNPRMGSYASY